MAKRRKKAGRPPAGEGGARVEDYPVLAHRIPAQVIERLKQTAAHERRPQWRVLVDAINEYAKRVLRG